MKTIIYKHTYYPRNKQYFEMKQAIDKWRADRGMTTVIVLDNKRVGYDAAGKFYKAEANEYLTFLRFPKDRDAVMFKLGYVGVDHNVTGDE